MIYDTHAHYDDAQFDEDREELLRAMADHGVGTIVNVSASYASCARVVDMVQEYPFMYAAVGIHPDEVGELNEDVPCPDEGIVPEGQGGCGRRDWPGLLLG